VAHGAADVVAQVGLFPGRESAKRWHGVSGTCAWRPAWTSDRVWPESIPGEVKTRLIRGARSRGRSRPASRLMLDTLRRRAPRRARGSSCGLLVNAITVSCAAAPSNSSCRCTSSVAADLGQQDGLRAGRRAGRSEHTGRCVLIGPMPVAEVQDLGGRPRTGHAFIDVVVQPSQAEATF